MVANSLSKNSEGKLEKEKSCFFISPIGEPGTPIRDRSDKVLEFIIRPAVKKFGYEVQRADEISDPGVIAEQVVERIKNDHLNQSQGGIYISGRCQRRGSACHPRVG